MDGIFFLFVMVVAVANLLDGYIKACSDGEHAEKDYAKGELFSEQNV